jgi:multicomponent Na+:H+ antiporter subunit D
MNAEAALLLALCIPLAGTFFIVANQARPHWREGATLLASLLLLGTVASLLPGVLAGGRPTVDLFEFVPGLALRLTAEPLGMIFAGVAALLWLLNSIYSIGYMNGNHEQHQTRFYACFAIAIASAIGIAFSGNLLTLFVFYEALTLSTYPLVTHKGTPEAMRAGRLYLGILLGTSIGFLLLAIVWTWQVAGSLDFTPGGILAGHIGQRWLFYWLCICSGSARRR